jgi:riboflavin biosynthesis pyrimidine reductase
VTPATLPALDLVVPTRERLEPDPFEARLLDLYAVPEQAARHVRGNMVATVDGAAWGPDHRTGTINDDADMRVFRVLRALADVVLIGAGTARAEGYTPLNRPAGPTSSEAAPLELALVTRSGHLPPELRDTDRPPFVITGSDGASPAADVVPRERLVVVPRADDDREVDLVAGLDALARRGLTRILTEGGPTLLAALLAADLVDELCVTTTPELVGPGPARIVSGSGPVGASSGELRGARLGHLLAGPTGTLLARWVLR